MRQKLWRFGQRRLVKIVIVRLGEEDRPPVTGFVARYRRRDFFPPRWRIAE